MQPHFARILYAIEFLIAILAVFTLWSQVGGQTHLDYIPWFWKLGIGLATSWACVRITVAFASPEPAARTRIWLWTVVLAVLMAAAGGLTYYAHLNEPQDEESDEGTAQTRLDLPHRVLSES